MLKSDNQSELTVLKQVLPKRIRSLWAVFNHSDSSITFPTKHCPRHPANVAMVGKGTKLVNDMRIASTDGAESFLLFQELRKSLRRGSAFFKSILRCPALLTPSRTSIQSCFIPPKQLHALRLLATRTVLCCCWRALGFAFLEDRKDVFFSACLTSMMKTGRSSFVSPKVLSRFRLLAVGALFLCNRDQNRTGVTRDHGTRFTLRIKTGTFLATFKEVFSRFYFFAFRAAFFSYNGIGHVVHSPKPSVNSWLGSMVAQTAFEPSLL